MPFFKRNTKSYITGKPEVLIVGLGNPGPEYEYTRHNAGFLCMDVICNKYGASVNRLKYRSLTGTAVIGGKNCLLIKPQTFMNDSGSAVASAASFYKIPPERIIVIFDDISLPEGSLRIRAKGSAGGHNGIKSIIACLGSDNFPRIKIGVGERSDPDEDLRDHVLGRFSKRSLETMRQTMTKAAEATELLVNGNIEEAMSKYNSVHVSKQDDK